MRSARKKCESGIYHVMVRGINKQDIFLFDADRLRFLEILRDCKQICGFELYAYCLMRNHVHLLIKEKDEPLDLIMKRIGSRYVGWYNRRHGRSGHLFQDRFCSECVETDEYFLTVLRYIHQNPVKAGICQRCEQYKWSSFGDYKTLNGLADTEFPLTLVEKKELLAFFNRENEDQCLDDEQKISAKKERDRKNFVRISGCRSKADFDELSKGKQNEIILQCKEAGLSRRSLSELTGLGENYIRNVK